jgi:hypothetical protein
LREDRHALEDALPFAKIHEVGPVHGELRILLAVVENAIEAAGFGVGKRVEQHAANHAEHGGVRADPDGEGQNGDEGEPGVLDEVA